jgi:hypothetical protein
LPVVVSVVVNLPGIAGGEGLAELEKVVDPRGFEPLTF